MRNWSRSHPPIKAYDGVIRIEFDYDGAKPSNEVLWNAVQEWLTNFGGNVAVSELGRLISVYEQVPNLGQPWLSADESSADSVPQELAS